MISKDKAKEAEGNNGEDERSVRSVSPEDRLADVKIPAKESSTVWTRCKAGLNPACKQAKKLLSVSFLVMLLLSLSMWYAIKLGYNYKTEMPFKVNVEGHEFKVKCVVEGKGGQLFARKFNDRNKIVLEWEDIDFSPSAVNPGFVVISPYSLQNAISAHNNDIKILSVGPVPEIAL